MRVMAACARMILAASAGHGGRPSVWVLGRSRDGHLQGFLRLPRALLTTGICQAPIKATFSSSTRAAVTSGDQRSEAVVEEDDDGEHMTDRNMANTQRVYTSKMKKFSGPTPSQCSRCWHEVKTCICTARNSPVANMLPHRIIIYMHVKVRVLICFCVGV